MSEQENQQESPGKKKIPFKLCFVSQNLVGRSNIQIGKPLKMPSIITPKFYRGDWIFGTDEGTNLRKQMEYLNVKGPKEKYEHPITENQKYGWYQMQLIDTDKTDPRLNFAKRANPFIKEHLMNYENIR